MIVKFVNRISHEISHISKNPIMQSLHNCGYVYFDAFTNAIIYN